MNIKKNFFKFSAILIFIFIFSLPFLLKAQTAPNQSEQSNSMRSSMGRQSDAFFGESSYSGARADSIIASAIQTVLSLLGIVFLILMVYSGYQWMTAGGNEDQVTQAKSRIKNAIIGIIIVVLAYAITAFIFKNLPGGSSNVAPGGSSGKLIQGDKNC